jgi:hypothetical protein
VCGSPSSKAEENLGGEWVQLGGKGGPVKEAGERVEEEGRKGLSAWLTSRESWWNDTTATLVTVEERG